ncbi:DUF6283 family protein [Deinococcus kurensis]|uniref:DUF6283 family protein n=1 Tax=Deinococcus kurensis TaxID=2662757 RepID=UPI001F478006|nr:DUF6283 family protein [Deinococcus kurensis]
MSRRTGGAGVQVGTVTARGGKIIGVAHTGPEDQVLTVKGGKGGYQRTPCAECPWRKDAPVGAFSTGAFIHSANCAEDGSLHSFGCHMGGADGNVTCAGFLLRGAEHNMSVRLGYIRGKYGDLDQTPPDLYEDYVDMAVANGVDPDHPALKRARRRRD